MKKWILIVIALLVAIAVVVIVNLWPGGEESLASLIDRSDKLVVIPSIIEPGIMEKDTPILFESSDRRDLDALKASLGRLERLEPGARFIGGGDPHINLYAKGEIVALIYNHRGKMIRCSVWDSDARLVDAEAFLKWFDDRNIPGPRKDYEAGLLQDKDGKGASSSEPKPSRKP